MYFDYTLKIEDIRLYEKKCIRVKKARTRKMTKEKKKKTFLKKKPNYG